MFKVGSIRKIEVKDFVTYSYAELFPGPNLNMLIGPNGTGKSTIVAAIILGLGGNPRVVGRGSKVSEYVKHNCNEATINIYLQGEREADIIKITRNFNTQDKTSWSLNNKKTVLKDILNCIKQYNIQVDNLCQFLPQDRVQDFAKLNQQQLLKEIQIAVCRTDLLEKQELLVEYRENYKKLEQVIEKNGVKLQETQDANLRLESKIENFSKKKEFLAKIQDIDRKLAWLQCDDLFEKLSEVKEDLSKATEINEKYRNAAKPIEKEIQTAKKLVSELQDANANVTRSIREHEHTTRNYLEKINDSRRQITEIEGEMNAKIAEIEQRNQEIETTASKIEELKNAQKELVKKCGSDAEIQARIQKIQDEMQKLKRHVTDLEDRKEVIVQAKQNKMGQLRAFENQVSRLENIKQQKLAALQKVDRNAYDAVLWLRNNKHLFKHEVFEPVMLEINVLDSKNGIYLENVIPMRDRVAFTCVDKQDMNSLIQHLREGKGLVVNVLHSGDKEGAALYQPKIPIEQLKKFGFYTYLHSLFTAPGPIMSYLCKTYRLHDIPIGNSETNKHFLDIPHQIGVFFSDKQRFSSSFSKYSKERSTRQNEIRSDGSLSVSVDVVHLEKLRGLISEIRDRFAQSDTQIKEFDNQIDLINEKVSKLGEEFKYIKSVERQAEAIEGRINAMQRKIEEMRQNKTEGDAIRKQTQNVIKKTVKNIGKLASELKSKYKALSTLNMKSSLNVIKIEKARRNVSYVEQKSEEIRRLMKESETTLNQVKESYANIKNQTKAVLKKAKDLSKNFTPDDKGFDEFRPNYDKLPSDRQQLEEEKFNFKVQIDCLNTADDDEMREYEQRVQLINTLQENVEKTHMDLSQIATRMDKLQEEWLEPLKAIVAEINTNFAASFQQMGCAGEVSINPGKDEKEFGQYGLCIKVTYRNGEPLQELNNIVQSGGERAVATAVFMLALQKLTPVPFRCVDEINQGMDVINERRIFDLLVESTSQPGTSQYFLITPKLVPGLKYSRSTMVHIVHNGPFIEQDRKWPMSKFCNPQRVQLH